MIAGIAFLNNTLELEIQKCREDMDPLDVQISFFAALDILEDSYFSETSECYHGLISPAVGLDGSDAILGVYAYSTPTNAKIMMLVDNLLTGDETIRKVFWHLHKTYVNAVSSPFLRSLKDSKKLVSVIEDVLRSQKTTHDFLGSDFENESEKGRK